MFVAGWETKRPFACPLGDGCRVAFRPGEMKRANVRNSSEMQLVAENGAIRADEDENGQCEVPRPLSTIRERRTVATGRGYEVDPAYRPRLESVWPNVMPSRAEREPSTRMRAIPISACHRGFESNICLANRAAKGHFGLKLWMVLFGTVKTMECPSFAQRSNSHYLRSHMQRPVTMK